MDIKFEDISRFYPSDEEIDAWVEEIWKESEKRAYTVEEVWIDPHPFLLDGFGIPYNHPFLMKFTVEGLDSFYVTYYQPISGPKPLLCFLPGYGDRMQLVSSAVAHDFACISVSPKPTLKEGWSVYPETIRTRGKGGYFEWLLQVAIAVKWTWKEKSKYVLHERVSFYGSSQGGGTAVILGSIFSNRGTKCVMADVPFLTNAPLAVSLGSYAVLDIAKQAMEENEFWHYAGLVDTLLHARRLDVPVMVTANEKDGSCPPETVRTLYEKLSSTKLLLEIKDREHWSNNEFERLVMTWAGMYA